MSYLTTKFKGVYRLKAPYDKTINDFPRKLDGSYEDCDVYIDCANNIQVFHCGGSTLQAYIPSKGRGRNIVRAIEEKFGSGIIFEIHETDSEVEFKFNYKNSDSILPLLKPKTSGASISPFSTKNLPKNTDYVIPDEQLAVYKSIIENVPKNSILALTHVTQNYLKSLVTKKNTWDMIRADMKLRGLKGKEYIHSIGKWDDYIRKLQIGVNELLK